MTAIAAVVAPVVRAATSAAPTRTPFDRVPVETTIAAVSWLVRQFKKHVGMTGKVERT
jgi:hypothetical protein